MTEGKVVDVEVVEDEGEDLDPTDLRALFFRKCKLTKDQRGEVEKDLQTLIKDAHETRADLDNLLVHWNDLAEGISPPKNFPWPNSSNLHIPVVETKLNEIHSTARETSLRPDQIFMVESVGDPLAPQQTAKAEQYLNYKCKRELGLVGVFSDIVWAAARDGTALGHVYYSEETKTVPVIKTYKSLREFMDAYPDVSKSGLTKTQYQKVLDKFAAGAGPVRLLEEVDKMVYRGPKVDLVELQDFLMSPMTAIRTEYARLVGKNVVMRAAGLRKLGEQEEWDLKTIEKVTTSADPGKQDQGDSTKNQIEGISKSYLDREKGGEFVIFNGIYRTADLSADGMEQRYLVYYHFLTATLLGITRYPYLHGMDNFVPVRVKKRPNRFLGRGLCQMLDDINIEINTQHNQRIDSRTISTVPSFKCKISARGEFDPSRPDSRFFPGKVFYLTDLNSVQQFEMKQTDTMESMQEETALMQLADRQAGTAAIRSGVQAAGDRKTPAAVQRMIAAGSTGRMDDYLEELAGNGVHGEGLDAIGEQILSILHQFKADDEVIPVVKGASLVSPEQPAAPAPAQAPMPAAPGPAGGPPGGVVPPGGPVPPQPLQIPGGAPVTPGSSVGPVSPQMPDKITITAQDLDDLQGRVRVQLAKTSMSLNPDNKLMRYLQVYGMLSMDPLVGGTPKGRLALDRTLLEYARVDNPDKYLPPDAQTAEQWMQMQQMIMQSMLARKGGRPGARTRGAGKAPAEQGGTGGPKGA